MEKIKEIRTKEENINAFDVIMKCKELARQIDLSNVILDNTSVDEKEMIENSNNQGDRDELYNNAVEIIAEGDREELSKLTGWLQLGPPNATIDKISIEWKDQPERKFSSFEIHQ